MKVKIWSKLPTDIYFYCIRPFLPPIHIMDWLQLIHKHVMKHSYYNRLCIRMNGVRGKFKLNKNFTNLLNVIPFLLKNIPNEKYYHIRFDIYEHSWYRQHLNHHFEIFIYEKKFGLFHHE